MSAQLYLDAVGSGELNKPCEGAKLFFSRKDVPEPAGRHSAVSCAETAEHIEMLFGFWTRVAERSGGDAALCEIALCTC